VELPKARTVMDSPVELPFFRYYELARRVVAAAYDGADEASDEVYRLEEQSTATCMKEKGFTYFPREPPETEDAEPVWNGFPLNGDALTEMPVLPDTLDEVRRVGYGVLALGEYTGSDQFEITTDDTANQEYYESLSDSAKRAYMLALVGVTEDDDPFEVAEDPDNCGARAAAEFPWPTAPDLGFMEPLAGMARVVGGPGFTIDENAGTMTTDPAGAPDSVDSLPEVVELDREFATCLTSSELSDAFLGWMQGSETAAPTTAYYLAVATAPDGSVFEMRPGQVYYGDEMPESAQSLSGSQAERDVAVVDFMCRKETDYVDRYVTALIAAQERYIASHQAELDKMEAAMEQFLTEHS
jgi:hypothetical protein